MNPPTVPGPVIAVIRCGPRAVRESGRKEAEVTAMLTMSPEYLKAMMRERELVSVQSALVRQARAAAEPESRKRLALPRPFPTVPRFAGGKA
jgi:hypothetical protein